MAARAQDAAHVRQPRDRLARVQVLDEVLGIDPVEGLVGKRKRLRGVVLEEVEIVVEHRYAPTLDLLVVARADVQHVGVEPALQQLRPAAALQSAQPVLPHQLAVERRRLRQKLECLVAPHRQALSQSSSTLPRISRKARLSSLRSWRRAISAPASSIAPSPGA